MIVENFFRGCVFAFSAFSGFWVVGGTLRWSGESGTRCFSGGIVFIDVLGILDATLSRFFSLTTERVSFTL